VSEVLPLDEPSVVEALSVVEVSVLVVGAAVVLEPSADVVGPAVLDSAALEELEVAVDVPDDEVPVVVVPASPPAAGVQPRAVTASHVGTRSERIAREASNAAIAARARGSGRALVGPEVGRGALRSRRAVGVEGHADVHARVDRRRVRAQVDVAGVEVDEELGGP
jgi:hypothetical protein